LIESRPFESRIRYLLESRISAKSDPVAESCFFLPYASRDPVALGKERDKAQDELKKVNAKLSNENFVTRAPEEVIGEMKERQKHWQARVEELEKMMGNLGS